MDGWNQNQGGNNMQGAGMPQGMPVAAAPQGTPITPGKTISVRIKTEVGVEFKTIRGTQTCVPNGVINVIVGEGSPFTTEQEVMGKIYQTVIPEAKAFMQKIMDEDPSKAQMLGMTVVMMRDKEFAPIVFPKLEALGLQVRTDISSISFRESESSREASKKAQAEADAAQEASIARQMGGAEQYQDDFVIFEQAVAPVAAVPATKVETITGAFATGTGAATLDFRDAAARRNFKLDMSGVYTLDVSKYEPDYYARKMAMMSDMILMNINMQLMDLRDVAVADLGSKADEIAKAAAQALRDSGENVVSVTIGKISMSGKDKMMLDHAAQRAEMVKDPEKMREQMMAAMEAARQQQLASWKAQGLTPLQGAAIEAEKAKKMFGPKYPDGSDVNAVNFLKNNGYPKELWEGAGAGAAPAAPQATAPQAAATAQAAPRPKFCMNCGKPLPPTGAFCQECGTRI